MAHLVYCIKATAIMSEDIKQVVQAFNLLLISIFFLFPFSPSSSISYHSVLEARLSSNSATIRPTFLAERYAILNLFMIVIVWYNNHWLEKKKKILLLLLQTIGGIMLTWICVVIYEIYDLLSCSFFFSFLFFEKFLLPFLVLYFYFLF